MDTGEPTLLEALLYRGELPRGDADVIARHQ